ncbi:MAG TPA: rhodanese-like domain-containing protein [Mucilaginibacter sp.]|nr:rhodanese-like domain-containing protein [Mucilaginibacter sp.]
MNSILELLKSGAVVVDVRSPGEYYEGHFSDSVNIPLSELPGRLEELKTMNDIIVCCASGIRSNKAMGILQQNGIACYDGGSWLNLKTLLTPNNQ